MSPKFRKFKPKTLAIIFSLTLLILIGTLLISLNPNRNIPKIYYKTTYLLESPIEISENRTSIFYAYNEANLLNIYNFRYFLETAVWENPSVDYHIIINGDKCTLCGENNPKLSLSNVKVYRRKNTGFDFGAYHHVLSQVGYSDSKYFIFLNCGVRGKINISLYMI